ncbi:hypothetical protein [Cryptosporangium phraense]|uniref:Uncharacterized protein n=1 Tax=Cryptosporangium phraense TaxID=2593070 RepID=A0A545APZ5_9ACTN|nr:hypothetical protein [Cryptosporangium phraense]TQS42805.1 hypothetical protein FL583_22370 [Cryptosporangium phraense]
MTLLQLADLTARAVGPLSALVLLGKLTDASWSRRAVLVCVLFWAVTTLASLAVGDTQYLTEKTLGTGIWALAWWMGGGGDEFRRGCRRAQQIIRDASGKLTVVAAPAGSA